MISVICTMCVALPFSHDKGWHLPIRCWIINSTLSIEAIWSMRWLIFAAILIPYFFSATEAFVHIRSILLFMYWISKTAVENNVNFLKEISKGHYYYVDKTMMIKDIVYPVKKKVVLITRPRRFRKSLNLSMLECFLDVRRKKAHHCSTDWRS